MQTLIIIILFLVLAVLVGFMFFLNKKLSSSVKEEKTEKTMQSVMDLVKITQNELSRSRQESQKVINDLRKEIKSGLDKNADTLQERLDNTAKVIGAVQKELGGMQEIGRSMKDLQDFLKSPKLRGNIGEQVLADLLAQCLPSEIYKMQYKFQNGQTVDAIIKTDKGLISIDSKFPMENFTRAMKEETEQARKRLFKDFQKDVKKHIASISKKYILPAEGTIDFALMYVPSESIYYQISVTDTELEAYAKEHRILIVSPNNFYYFLRVIMIGLEGKRIEEASKKILVLLAAVQKDSENFAKELGVLTSHIANSKNAIDRVNNEYGKLSNKMEQVKLL